MIKRLRIQLTFWFTFLVMLVYSLDAGFAVWLFNYQLVSSINNNLTRLCQEIRPAIQSEGGRPTLKEWGVAVQKRHLYVSNTVQLFDADRNLLEEYGPKGYTDLACGRVKANRANFYSTYEKLSGNGFIQVQLSALPHDQSVKYFLLTKLVRVLTICIAFAICGWFFSAKAIKPVVSTLKTLRTFVDDAGHELNTPVNLIENSVETLESELKERGLSSDILQIIRRASTRLKNLSTNLLLLAKLENPELALRETRVKPQEVLEEVVSVLAEKAGEGGVKIETEPFPEAYISADKEALWRLFTNLIENALRYTPAGGNILISASRRDPMLAITIRDSGIGIPKESLSYVFDRFYRVDKARTHADGGAGLGLSIVKAIVEAHKGNIRVESELGKGTAFIVNLPLYSG